MKYFFNPYLIHNRIAIKITTEIPSCVGYIDYLCYLFSFKCNRISQNQYKLTITPRFNYPGENGEQKTKFVLDNFSIKEFEKTIAQIFERIYEKECIELFSKTNRNQSNLNIFFFKYFEKINNSKIQEKIKK